MSDSIGERLGFLAVGIIASIGLITCLRAGADYFFTEPKEVKTIPTAEELVKSVQPRKYEDYYSDELVTQTAIICLQEVHNTLKLNLSSKSADCYVTNFDSRYRAPSNIFQQYVQNVVSFLEKAHYKVELIESTDLAKSGRHLQLLRISWK